MWYCNENKFSELNGRTIVRVSGLGVGGDEVRFACADGSEWRMYHDQDCCESVQIADIVGDPADALGIVHDAREDTSDKVPEGYVLGEYECSDSFTWTFYTLRTSKGTVTIRWLGESNGYYSESVSFVRTDDARATGGRDGR